MHKDIIAVVLLQGKLQQLPQYSSRQAVILGVSACLACLHYRSAMLCGAVGFALHPCDWPYPVLCDLVNLLCIIWQGKSS